MLVEEGLNDCAISRATEVPRSTVREMRLHAAGPTSLSDGERCWRCWEVTRRIRFGAEQYAELLGLYLGDGHVVDAGRTHRLRIFLDGGYPQIVAEAESLLIDGFPANSVKRHEVYEGRMVVLSVYCRHLPCLLPQHGPGAKHQRPLAFESWQSLVVAAHPWPLIKGLIRSDGCSFVNRTGPYEYLSYHFSNRSEEITDLLCDALERVGVFYRRTYSASRKLHGLRINRRASVALMVEHVGVKR